MRYGFFILTILLVTSCSSIFVAADYDKNVNFSQYRTYEFDLGSDSGLLELDERRFIRYTDSVLQAKGYVQSENPDFWIKFNAQEYNGSPNNTLGVGIGGTGGNVGIGVSGGIPLGGSARVQELVVQLISSNTNQSFWEAGSESSLPTKSTPKKRDAFYRKLVSKIFKKFPIDKQ